jgi:hypothetical protein
VRTNGQVSIKETRRKRDIYSLTCLSVNEQNSNDVLFIQQETIYSMSNDTIVNSTLSLIIVFDRFNISKSTVSNAMTRQTSIVFILFSRHCYFHRFEFDHNDNNETAFDVMLVFLAFLSLSLSPL